MTAEQKLEEQQGVQTPATHPYHLTVGVLWRSADGRVFFCESFMPDRGYRMTDILAPYEAIDVPGNAIGTAFRAVRGTWKLHEVVGTRAASLWLVDARECDHGVQPRMTAPGDVRKLADWRTAIFVKETHARAFARELQRALEPTH
ncbi:hypothetical protein F6X40_17585 [Paraburkholderia sp. UCT31]|uniref:hypothetical protein n=1 Tax=Paraburkholderia sp. UCT31 TaxID=2615209 RepID=UPI0016551416|nr:hypothetical protein [Paraburkholderia sp. UCT31]MBC8738573.1 hypothetical protein [Paraburkholderia sp. UCT31]